MANSESIAREMVDAINRNDMSRYRQLLHPDYSYRGGDGQVQRGQDAGVAIVQMYRTAFPDDMALDVSTSTRPATRRSSSSSAKGRTAANWRASPRRAEGSSCQSSPSWRCATERSTASASTWTAPT